MAKFRFKLAGYLNLKEKLEDRKKQEYGRAVGALEREKAEKARLSRAAAENLAAFRKSLEKPIDPALMRAYGGYAELMDKRLAAQGAAVEKAEGEAEKKRLELVEAVKEKKALEILRGKALEEFGREEKLAEQRVVDEIVSYRFKKGDDA
ncbi:MAG: flagellar export protein FliJ [Firmicutes bacterium]|nr:flagellar export protein FliJ [Bacillota bacterium]